MGDGDRAGDGALLNLFQGFCDGKGESETEIFAQADLNELPESQEFPGIARRGARNARHRQGATERGST